MQGRSGKGRRHAGSTRKACEQVRVFVQVCTNISPSKADNSPLLLLPAPPLSTLPQLLSLPCHLSRIDVTVTHTTPQPHQTPGSSQQLFGDREEGTDLSILPMKGPGVLLEPNGCKSPECPSSLWPSALGPARHRVHPNPTQHL